MPLIAALTPAGHVVSHTDEIVERVKFDVPADLVAITTPTPSAVHAYALAQEFGRRGVRVVIGGPHATALPDEAARFLDDACVDVATVSMVVPMPGTRTFSAPDRGEEDPDHGLVEVRREETLCVRACSDVAR
jgi:radical SAM superfamily enzyme YgiQ (UPF0313 family)